MEKETYSRSILAKGYFEQGYNCCQSVVLAWAEDIGLSDEAALRLSSAFGGGMGKMREVCGALAGSFMVAGMKKGYVDPDAGEDKEALYRLVQDLAEAFRQKHGSILCKDLIGEDYTPGDAKPRKRTSAYYESRPCTAIIEDTVRLLDEKLK